MPDVSALVQQMQQTLTAIHETITSLDPTVHDEKLDALEAERDDILAKLLAAFEKESTDLSEKRKHEREEIAEKRRKEDEEIAARRKREDEEIQSRDLTEDEQREHKLAAEKKDLEENTDHKMEEVEDEAERAINEGHEKLRELEGKRQVRQRNGYEPLLRCTLTRMITQEIHRMIDEQMKIPLPTPPKRKRRGTTTTAKSAPNGPTAAEASQPEPQSQDRSIPVETQEPAAEPEPVKAAEPEEPAESKQEETATEEPVADKTESKSSEQEASHPENSDVVTREVITEDKIVPEETPAAEVPQSEEPTALVAEQPKEEVPAEKEAPPAEEPSVADNEQPAAAEPEPAPEAVNDAAAEEVLANKATVPEETTTEEAAPAADHPAETETKPEHVAGPNDEPTTEDAPVAERSVPEEQPAVEEPSAQAAAPEESQAEVTPAAAVEEAPANEAPVENAPADKEPEPEQHAEEAEALVGSNATQEDVAENKESAPENEIASQPRDLAASETSIPSHEVVEEQKADNAEPTAEQDAEPAEKPAAEPTPEPAVEEEIKPRDLDAERENPPALETVSEPAPESVAEPVAEPAAESAAEEELKPRDLDAEQENPSASELASEPTAEPAAEDFKPRDLDAERAAKPTTESAAEPPAEEEFKPRDLDAERENLPAPETAELSTEPVKEDTGAEMETSRDLPDESSAPVQQPADESATSAEQPAEQSVPEGGKDDDATAEVSEESKTPSAPVDSALSEKADSDETIAHEEPDHEEPVHEVTREVDTSHLESPAKVVSEQQEHTLAAVEESPAPAGIVEGGAAEEYLEMAKADAAEPQHDESEAPKSEEHPSTVDSAPVAEAHVEPSQEAAQQAEEPPAHEAPAAVQEEPEASSDQPQERDVSSDAHEAQPETQGDEIGHHETPAAEEAKEQHDPEVEAKPQAEEHPTEHAGEKQVESAETTAEAEQSSQPEPESEPEPEHKPSEVAEQAPEPEQTTAVREDEGLKDAEPVPTAREVANDDHHVEAPVEETKAPAEETQAPVEEAKVSIDSTPAAEAQVEESQAEESQAAAKETHAPAQDASTDAPVAETPAEEKTREITEVEAPSQALTSEPVSAEAAPTDTQEAQTEQPGGGSDNSEAAVSDEAGAVATAPAEETKMTEPADISAPAAEAPASENHAKDSVVEAPVEEESVPAPSSEAPTSEEPATEASATEPAREEAPTVDEASAVKETPAVEEVLAADETSAVEETPVGKEVPVAEAPAVEEVLTVKETPAMEEAPAAEETHADAPSVESKAENPTEDTVQPSAEEKTVDETPREVPAAEAPKHDSSQPTATETHPDDSTTAPVDAPVETSTEPPSASREIEPATEAPMEASAEKSVPENEVAESAAPADESVSHHDDVHKDAPSAEAHEVEQPAQVSEEPEKTSQQDSSALDTEPREAHHDDYAPTSELHTTEEPTSLPTGPEAKDVIQPDEHEHSEHEGGEKMSDSGYDSALTGSRTLDDPAGQHHDDEALSTVQEDTRPADDELHPAEAEIQDQKEEQQSEIHEGAGNVISPSKGEDVQDSDNSQAAETFEDGAPQASEPVTEEVKHEVVNTEGSERELPAADRTTEVEVEQPAQAEHHDTAPSSVEAVQPEPVQESNVEADHTPESHEEQEASSLKEVPDQTPRDLDAPAAMPAETDAGARNDSHNVATSDIKPSTPLERSLTSTQPNESEHLAQEQPGQDTMEEQQASVPTTAVVGDNPSDQPPETEASREVPSQEVESQNPEPEQVIQESAPQTSLSNRRESKPTISLPTRSGHDDPNEGLFAVPPTPREEVDEGKPAQLQDDDSVEHNRPEGTVDASSAPKEAPQQENQVDAEVLPKADLPHEDSPEESVQHSGVDEPQIERDLPAKREAAPSPDEAAPTTELASQSADVEDKDDHSQVEALAAPQVHDVQPEPETVIAPSSHEEHADVHVRETVQDRDIHNDSVPAAEQSPFQAEPLPAPMTVAQEVTHPESAPEAVAHDAHDQRTAVGESTESYNVSPVSSAFESAYSERRDDDVFETPYEQAHSAVMQRDLSYGGRFEDEDDHDDTLHAAQAPQPHVNAPYAAHDTYGAGGHAMSSVAHIPPSAVEPHQPQKFEQALGQVPDETSAHTVQGTDQLFEDSYDDDSGSMSEYGEAVVSPPERIVYQAQGDDHNIALGGNQSSTSLGRNSIASARSLEPTTPVRVTEGSYLSGANIVRADWAGEHEEELRVPSHRGTPHLEPSSSQDGTEISPFALRNPPATEEAADDKGLSSSRWNPQRPSTPPPVPPKTFNNPFRTQQTPEPAPAEADLVPRDVTNMPWHARNDSIPASMHSQTTLSSVTSSPIHSALPADKHEPVIRDSWVPAPGYQQYLSSWTGRTRGDSGVSNNSEYDPFKADTVGGTAPVKSSIYNPFQARSRAESSVSAAPSNTSATAPSNNASPGRGSALFQKMRNIFEAQNAGPDPNASMEPMRSPHRRPPSGSSHPTFTPTQQQVSSSERLRDQMAYDPYREPGTRDDTEAEYDERFGLLRDSERGGVHSGAAGNEHAAHR